MNMQEKELKLNALQESFTIYSIELLDDRIEFNGEKISFRFRVSCSKGTYIRTLAVMIGEALRVSCTYVGFMSELSLEHSL